MLDFLTLQTTSTNATLVSLVYSVILAFLLASLIGITYEKTFRGLSYSRNYVQAIILSAIVAATIMHAIGDSLARGLGMIGALAIIRFRTNFRDPRDIIFMFASLAAGIASGVLAYTAALVGTLMFCFVAFVLYYTPLGQYRFFDGMLRFSMANTDADRAKLETVLREHCTKFVLVTLRDAAQGKTIECAYHVKFRKGHGSAELVDSMNSLESVTSISVSLQEATTEL